MLRTAFDLGITHFDLANNYGPEYGSAETNFGKILKETAGSKSPLFPQRLYTMVSYLSDDAVYIMHFLLHYL